MSFILLHPEATQGVFLSRKAGATESGPNQASAFQALVQGISAHLIGQIMDHVRCSSPTLVGCETYSSPVGGRGGMNA